MVRAATTADAPELERLRAAFSQELAGALFEARDDGRWRASFHDVLAQELAADRMRVVVVDVGNELAACGVATIDQWLPAPHLVDGRVGHIINVYTLPAYRRRGYSRAVVEALLAWFAERNVLRVDLHASASAEPLYRSLGFVDHPDPSLSRQQPS